MLINRIYEVLKQFSGKDYASGHFSIDEFNRYAEIVQGELLNEKFNSFGADSYDKSIQSDVSPFRVTVDLYKSSKTSIYAVFDKPSDYRFFSSARGVDTSSGKVRIVDIDLVRDFEVGERMSSEIDVPTLTYPIIIEYGTYLGVAPREINNISLTYIKTPEAPVYGSAIVNNRPVFDASTSVDFTFGDVMYDEITMRMAKYLGVQIREQELFQYSQVKEQDRLT
jgi:hypothetical protein